MGTAQLTEELQAQLEAHPLSELIIVDEENAWSFEIVDVHYERIDNAIIVELERV
jgi:hypothetical protein